MHVRCSQNASHQLLATEKAHIPHAKYGRENIHPWALQSVKCQGTGQSYVSAYLFCRIISNFAVYGCTRY